MENRRTDYRINTHSGRVKVRSPSGNNLKFYFLKEKKKFFLYFKKIYIIIVFCLLYFRFFDKINGIAHHFNVFFLHISLFC